MNVAQKNKALVWLGAEAKMGMALPDAKPIANQMYCPRGVYINDSVLLGVDSGNHRILGWYLEDGKLPESHSAADFVMGQDDFESEGPKLLHLPTGVTVVGDTLLVADAWHHRVLGFSHFMKRKDEYKPDFVLGQDNFSDVELNKNGEPSASSMYWPYGINYVHDRLYVADTGNRRVLFWEVKDGKLPDSSSCADGVIGQDDFSSKEENRGQISNNTYRWAHDIAGDKDKLYIADAGNHRVLGWSNPPSGDNGASLLLGQEEFDKGDEFPYQKQSASMMRFPYGISYSDDRLAVADTANNRVLLFEDLPQEGKAISANQVIGQPDFESNGENNWKSVTYDSLCWPYGIHMNNELLAISDSGNNRIMVWKV